jgi:hypothetical protein
MVQNYKPELVMCTQKHHPYIQDFFEFSILHPSTFGWCTFRHTLKKSSRRVAADRNLQTQAKSVLIIARKACPSSPSHLPVIVNLSHASSSEGRQREQAGRRRSWMQQDREERGICSIIHAGRSIDGGGGGGGAGFEKQGVL